MTLSAIFRTFSSGPIALSSFRSLPSSGILHTPGRLQPVKNRHKVIDNDFYTVAGKRADREDTNFNVFAPFRNAGIDILTNIDRFSDFNFQSNIVCFFFRAANTSSDQSALAGFIKKSRQFRHAGNLFSHISAGSGQCRCHTTVDPRGFDQKAFSGREMKRSGLRFKNLNIQDTVQKDLFARAGLPVMTKGYNSTV